MPNIAYFRLKSGNHRFDSIQEQGQKQIQPILSVPSGPVVQPAKSYQHSLITGVFDHWETREGEDSFSEPLTCYPSLEGVPYSGQEQNLALGQRLKQALNQALPSRYPFRQFFQQ